MIKMPNMLMAGAAGRNRGKTEFLCRAIRAQSKHQPVVAIKVTTIDDALAEYRNIQTDFVISREKPADDNKDTHRMLRSGAACVYWLRVKRPHLKEGLDALLVQIEQNGIDLESACLVMESGGARNVIEPGLFFIIQERDDTLKPAVAEVAHWTDQRVNVSGEGWDLLPDDLLFENGRWGLKENAGAIILCGGTSRRMGEDKALIKRNGLPMIQTLADHLTPHFMSLMISGSFEKYGFTGYDVIDDLEPDQGPLMGLLSTLQESEYDLNFVTACDVPDIPLPFVRRMLQEIGPHDAVTPRIAGKAQPLLAVYRKSIISEIKNLLSENRRAVHALLDRINVHYIDIDADWYYNLNTPNELEEYRRTNP